MYLPYTDVKNVNFDIQSEVEEYFKDILLRLKEFYYIDIAGFYNINAFIDKEEGMVFRIEKDDIDYFNTFHQLEIRMTKEDAIFFYEVEDVFSLPLEDIDMYIYNDKIYVRRQPNKKVYPLYEFGKLIYENTNKIINHGKKMTKTTIN